MAGRKKLCPHCGASMMEHRHNLGRALVEGLDRLARSGKPTNLKFLRLTRNQWDNFQKLRYWDLVEKHDDGSGNRKGGVWRITERGLAFLAGRIRVPRHAVTYRGERVKYEGDEVHVTEVVENYQYRGDYMANARPHRDEGGQGTLWGQDKER